MKVIEFLANGKVNEILALLGRFYWSSKINPILMILVFWLFWPGGMWVAAHLFEHRKVYTGKGQSHMFMYGDPCLGIAIVAFIGMHYVLPVKWSWVYSYRYMAATAVFFFVAMLILRKIDTQRYQKDCKNTPTKLAHDFSGYFVCAWLLFSYGLPQLINAIQDTSRFATTKREWFVFGVCAAWFIIQTIYDVTHMPSDEELLKMHPPFKYPWQK